MRVGRIAAVLVAGALLAGGIAGCGDGDDSSGAPNGTTTATGTTAIKSSKPAVSDELRAVRADFKTEFSGTSWYPAVDRIEGIFGGWLYIETDLRPDNPDTDDLARSICSGGLAVGIGTIDGLQGVSVYGIGSEKIKECEPYQPVE